MAKELPYFRFNVSEWMNGDIEMENYESKGLFVDICAWYWFKDCSVTKVMLEKKFIDLEKLTILFDSNIIKVEGENLCIEFLNEQYDILSNRRKARQAAGSKGGKQKRSNAKAKLKQKSSYKDKDKDKDKDNIIKEDSKKIQSQCFMENSGVTLDDISQAFLKTDDLKGADHNYYFNQVMDWGAANGKMKKDWVAAVRNWARGDLGKGQLKLLPYKPKRLGDEEVRR